MARQCGVDFISTGWSHTCQPLRQRMQENRDDSLERVAELYNFLFA